MARRLRIHVPGAFYHVTLRGNHRQPIFFRPEDRLLLNDIVATTVGKLGARLHAYCWMGNHIHMLAQVSDAPLGRVVLRIASAYARKVQTRLETTGHLFERRYHAVLVDADRYLLALLRYIHLNPVRAGLVRVADDYPWSSHHAYAGRRREPWVTTDLALTMLGSSRIQAHRHYRLLVDARPDVDAVSPLLDSHPADARILGDDRFRESMGLDRLKPRPAMTLEQLIAHACRLHSIDISELSSGVRNRGLSRVRAWIGHEAVAQHIASLSAAARHLNRSESSLRELVARHFPAVGR